VFETVATQARHDRSRTSEECERFGAVGEVVVLSFVVGARSRSRFELEERKVLVMETVESTSGAGSLKWRRMLVKVDPLPKMDLDPAVGAINPLRSGNNFAKMSQFHFESIRIEILKVQE